MYYPSLFPTVRPFDPRPAPLGGPLEVPVLGTGRERENPLDLSVKTVRQTPDSTAEAEELMMLDHRKLASLAASHSLSAMGRQLAPGASAPSLLDPSLFRFPYSTDSSACTHSGATLLPGFTPQFCLDRTPGVPPTLSSHPMMSSFLQQQQRDRCMEQHQAMYARTPSQHVPFFDPASLPLHLRVGGGNLTPREAALLSSRGLYSPALPTPMALPAFSLYPDRLEEKGAFTSLRNPSTDKTFLNGSSLDPARFTEHLQRLREQHLHQAAKCTGLCCAPLAGLGQPHAVSCACCLQNPSQSAVCNRGSVGCVTSKDNSKMCNGTCDFLPPGLSLLPRPTAADIRLSMGPYCAGLSDGAQRDESANHLFQSSGLWATGLPTTSKTAFSVPKKKESQKDSSRASKENSLEKEKQLSAEKKESSKSHSKAEGKRDDREVIVIDEEAALVQRTSAVKTELSRKAECDGKDKVSQKNHSYSGGLIVPKREPDHPIVPVKMPLLEAVRPNEGSEPVEIPTCAASPLGPPPLVAAVNGPSANKHPLQVSPASDKVLLLPEFAGQSCQKPASPREAARSPKQAAKVNSPSVTCPRDDVVRAPIPRLPVISTAPSHLTPPHFASPLQPPTEPLFGELPVHTMSPQQCDDTTVLQKLLALPTTDGATAGSANLTNTCGLFPIIMSNDFESRQSKKRLAAEGSDPSGQDKRLKVVDSYPEVFQAARDDRLNCVQHPGLHFDRPDKQHPFPECPRFPEYPVAPVIENIPAVLSLKVEPPAEVPSTPVHEELPIPIVKTERPEPFQKPRFAYFKPRALIKRSLRRTTFEDIRREAKRLAGLRAKRKLRRRLLARLYPRKQSEDESCTEKRDNGETPLLAKLTLSWQPQRLLYNYQFVRRRRVRSGLDLISRHRRKKSSSALSRDDGKRPAQIPSVVTSAKVTTSDSSSRSQGVPPELKRVMVNKALGETILHRAARLGYSDVVLYCLETSYCDVNARDNAGYTPLHECCSRGNLLIAAALLQYGADVNASAAGGIRPLHDAVENDHVELVRLLLSYGADPTIATYSGLVPLKLARSAIMGEFLQGFLADISGETEGRPTLPWRFRGSARFLDPEESGYDVFDGVPSDPEGEGEGDDDFLFEVSDSPHLPTYRLRLPAACSKAQYNYLKLEDVLSQTGLTRDRFNSLYGGGIDVVSIPRHQFEASATCSQLLACTRLDSVESERTVVEVVRLDSRVRDILGIETITVR